MDLDLEDTVADVGGELEEVGEEVAEEVGNDAVTDSGVEMTAEVAEEVLNDAVMDIGADTQSPVGEDTVMDMDVGTPVAARGHEHGHVEALMCMTPGTGGGGL